MNFLLLSVTLTVIAVVYGQELSGNQLTDGNQGLQQQEQQPMAPSGQDVRSNPQIIVLDKVHEPHHKPVLHKDSVQAFIIQRPHHELHHEQVVPHKIIIKEEHKPHHVLHHEHLAPHKIIIKEEHKHKPQEIIISGDQVIEIPSHKPLPVLHKHCTVFGRKGECTAIPHFLSCVTKGGVLAPDPGECPFTQSCCVSGLLF